MIHLILFDMPPEPSGFGPLLAALLLVIGFILMLAAGLVVFLWYRKRSLGVVEMIRPDRSPIERPAQPSSPNQL